jgi:hypothetical protein
MRAADGPAGDADARYQHVVRVDEVINSPCEDPVNSKLYNGVLP